MTESALVRVAALSDLVDCEPVAVDVEEHEILLVKLAGTVHALSNICSHEEVWLDTGIVFPESCEIECPMHEGRFDLRTGAATHEPCTEPIRSYPVRVDGDDVLIDLS